MKSIKLIIVTLVMCFVFTSCNKNKELHKITDGFVESLQTTYTSYGLINTDKYSKYTKDSLYRIMPIGRLINVKIEKEVKDEEYEELKNDLKEHYKDNKNVNDVYICNGGTVMIDCRN